MKNFVLMIVAVVGLSATVSFAQTEPTKVSKTPQMIKTEKGKKKTVQTKKGTTVRKEVPVSK